MTERLALNGGEPVITSAFKPYNSIGSEEADAVKQVIESGNLSQYLGVWTPEFYGGSKVQEFERACEDHFQVNNAITVNSWTSGLIAPSTVCTYCRTFAIWKTNIQRL